MYCDNGFEIWNQNLKVAIGGGFVSFETIDKGYMLETQSLYM